MGWWQGVDSTSFLLESLWKSLFPCPSQLLEAACSLWFVEASFTFKARGNHWGPLISPLSPPLPLSSTCEDPYDSIEPTWTIQDHLPIWRSNDSQPTCHLQPELSFASWQSEAQQLVGAHLWGGALFCHPHFTTTCFVSIRFTRESWFLINLMINKQPLL